MDKYNNYFKQFEKQFGIYLDDNIEERFKNIKDNCSIVLTNGRRSGTYLLQHLVKLYDFYETNTLSNVVKLCDYFYIVKLNKPENKKTDTYCITTIGTNYIIGEIKWW